VGTEFPEPWSAPQARCQTVLKIRGGRDSQSVEGYAPSQCPTHGALSAKGNWWHDGVMAKAPAGFSLAIEYYREEDGRWLADIPALPGVTAYGRTRKQATAAVEALALRLIADRLEHGEAVPGPMNVSFIAA